MLDPNDINVPRRVTRARMILACAEGKPPTAVARGQRVAPKTVDKWRHRFQESTAAGLADQTRSGQPSVIDEATFEQVLTLTTQRIPREATQWRGALPI